VSKLLIDKLASLQMRYPKPAPGLSQIRLD